MLHSSSGGVSDLEAERRHLDWVCASWMRAVDRLEVERRVHVESLEVEGSGNEGSGRSEGESVDEKVIAAVGERSEGDTDNSIRVYLVGSLSRA